MSIAARRRRGRRRGRLALLELALLRRAAARVLAERVAQARHSSVSCVIFFATAAAAGATAASSPSSPCTRAPVQVLRDQRGARPTCPGPTRRPAAAATVASFAPLAWWASSAMLAEIGWRGSAWWVEASATQLRGWLPAQRGVPGGRDLGLGGNLRSLGSRPPPSRSRRVRSWVSLSRRRAQDGRPRSTSLTSYNLALGSVDRRFLQCRLPLKSKVGAFVAGIPLALFGLFIAFQTTTLRFTFDDDSFALVKSDLSSTGENVVVGGENDWAYKKFVNYDFFPSESFPILVYFKETQTPEDQWNVGPGEQANSAEAIANAPPTGALPGDCQRGGEIRA